MGILPSNKAAEPVSLRTAGASRPPASACCPRSSFSRASVRGEIRRLPSTSSSSTSRFPKSVAPRSSRPSSGGTPKSPSSSILAIRTTTRPRPPWSRGRPCSFRTGLRFAMPTLPSNDVQGTQGPLRSCGSEMDQGGNLPGRPAGCGDNGPARYRPGPQDEACERLPCGGL